MRPGHDWAVIDPKTLTEEHVGRMVRYTAQHGETETGTISGWNEEYIFVRYGGSITGKATSPEQLELIEAFQLAFRGYKDGAIVFEKFETVPFAEIDQVMPRLATEHAAALAGRELYMLEIEFLDESDPKERLLRFGTDPRDMERPIKLPNRTTVQ